MPGYRRFVLICGIIALAPAAWLIVFLIAPSVSRGDFNPVVQVASVMAILTAILGYNFFRRILAISDEDSAQRVSLLSILTIAVAGLVTVVVAVKIGKG